MRYDRKVSVRSDRLICYTSEKHIPLITSIITYQYWQNQDGLTAFQERVRIALNLPPRSDNG
ncbi:hypothetical protein LC605_15170 [Nostoc sp. CHAB 5836]|nr:hypothetical protein [Nostoc sp. CHAB 5836]